MIIKYYDLDAGGSAPVDSPSKELRDKVEREAERLYGGLSPIELQLAVMRFVAGAAFALSLVSKFPETKWTEFTEGDELPEGF